MLLPHFASRSLLVDTDSRQSRLGFADTAQHHFGAIQVALVDLPVPQLRLPRRRVNANAGFPCSPPSIETTTQRSPPSTDCSSHNPLDSVFWLAAGTRNPAISSISGVLALAKPGLRTTPTATQSSNVLGGHTTASGSELRDV